MIIDIDERAGFCFGVEKAVKIAGKAIEDGEEVYSLGPIVHNDLEVERLRREGLTTITHEEFALLSNCKVLIRAHGEPPATYETALRNRVSIIDATCPIVHRLQKKIKNVWDERKQDNRQVAIFGKRGHAEVIGLLGQTGNGALLLENTNDIEKIDVNRPLYLFAQTTMGVADYKELSAAIRKKMSNSANKSAGETPDLVVNNTICGQVSCREPKLTQFAAFHDLIIFVSGRESSNGRMLFAACREKNRNSYMISSPDEIDSKWFMGKKSVGISGATSTPGWLIEEVAEKVRSLTGQGR